MSDEAENPHEAKTNRGAVTHESATMTPGQPATTSSGFPVSNWERYEFVSFIGEGGMGRVYKALDPKLNRHVALKFIRGEDPVALERFVREARVQARIEQDFICKVYETGEVEGRMYIAMQYIEGQTLTRMRDELTLEQKVKLIKESAEGIQAAHRLGLIHRDIKPGNIMVEKTEDGWHPYVLDFGLARETQAAGITVTGALVGTPGYMAPEQAWGDFRQLDRRMDVYGLGATLYFLLGGHSPFESESSMVALRRMLEEDVAPLHTIVKNVPEDLETVVMKCLEKEPERRYESARALANDLQRWLDGEPVLARKTSLSYRLMKRARKNKALVAVSGAAIVAILILAAYGIQTTLQARTRAALAQRFGQQIERMDAILRIGHTIPLHDTRKERRMIGAQVEEIRTQLSTLGSVAIGPGNYALGRAALALDDPTGARKYLETAWNSDYREPEVAYALGLALGRIYQHELESVETIRNKDVREAKKKELEHKYRDPAVRYLKSGANSISDAPEYVEGLIAFYEKRFADGLQKANEAAQRLPWLYEARLLEGDIYTARGNAKRAAGDNQNAMQEYTRAKEAYADAVRIGESDGEAYEGLCMVSLNLMYTRIYSTGGDLSGETANANTACGKAMQADPDRASPHVRMSNVYWIQATSQNLAGENSEPALQSSIHEAQAALQLDPKSALAYKNLGTAFQILGNTVAKKGSDPSVSLAQAIDSYSKAVALASSDITIYNSLGNTYAIQGDYEKDNGRDPRNYYRESIETFEKGISIDSQFAYIYSNLGVTYKDLSVYEEDHGFDPEANMNAAIKNYKKCLELKPDDNFAWNNLANEYKNIAYYYLRTGRDPSSQIEQGIRALDTPLKINPEYSTQYSNLGELYNLKAQFAILKGQDPSPYFRDSIKALERQIEVKKNDAGTFIDLAGTYLSMSRYELQSGAPSKSLEKAEELIRKALTLETREKDYAMQKLSEVKLLQARFMVREGRAADRAFAEADQEMRAVQIERPNNAYVWKDAAELAWRRASVQKSPDPKLIREGLSAAAKTLKIHGRLAEAYAIQGKLYALLAHSENKGENERLAKESIDHAFKLNPYLHKDY